MSSRWSALLVWGLAAAAAVFWALRLFVLPAPVPPQALVADNGVSLVGDLTRLLGAPPIKAPEAAAVVPDAASRFRLTGVVATRSARDPQGPAAPGLALISVDGKPPQAYRVGALLDNQLVLQSVGLRSARIGPDGGATGFVLELPPPAPPATGVPSVNGTNNMVGTYVPPTLPPPGALPPPGLPPGAVAPQMNQGVPAGQIPMPGLQPQGAPPPANPPRGMSSQGNQ